MRTSTYEIQAPIWNGGKKCIGIADFRLANIDVMNVRITYRRKDGTKSFPNLYSLPAETIKTYPTQVQKGVTLHIVPLTDWEQSEDIKETVRQVFAERN